MPGKRNKRSEPAPGETGHDDHNHGSNPAYPYEADENLEKDYQGYDEERGSFDPRYQQDYDVDENDVNQRNREYKKVSLAPIQKAKSRKKRNKSILHSIISKFFIYETNHKKQRQVRANSFRGNE